MTWCRNALNTALRFVVRKGPQQLVLVATAAMLIVFSVGFSVLFASPVHGSGSCGNSNTPGCGWGYTCPVIRFVAVTGSGEYPSGNNLSVSPPLNALYNSLSAALPPVERDHGALDEMVVPYSAASIDVITGSLQALHWDDPSAMLGAHIGEILGKGPGAVAGYLAVLGIETRNALAYSIPEYLASERDGVSQLRAVYNNTRATCPNTKFVLAGYSQGAMVVHDFLNQLADTGSRAQQQSIIGAVLLADPYRTKFAGSIQFGTAAASGYGVCDFASLFARCATTARLHDVARMFQSRTVTVCMYDDPICDTSDFLPDLGNHYLFESYGIPYVSAASAKSFLNYAASIHGSYSYVQPTVTAGKLMARFVTQSA